MMDANVSEFSSDHVSKFMTEIHFKLQTLKNEERSVRRATLQNLELQWNDAKDNISESDFRNLFESNYKPLLLLLGDPVEYCRETAAKVLLGFVEKEFKAEYVPFFISTLLMSLASPDERESSEEVRLIEIEMLCLLVKKTPSVVLLKHVNDIVHILVKCIMDPVPEIKRKASICVTDLAFSLRSDFLIVSGTLVNPLLHILTHQHYKTRVATVIAIGAVFQYGNAGDLKDVISHIAQRLFDSSPIVRINVAKVVGTWLREHPDRYSYFPYLLPLMLSSLSDNIAEVRNEAEDIWKIVGETYLEENQKEYKDQIDFPKPVPDHYPGNQPTLGCRVLVQKYFSTILPPLLRDIDDLFVETRLKSIKLLHVLLLHCEEKATMKSQMFLEAINVSVREKENREIVETALKTASLFGFFIESKIWTSILLPSVVDKPTPSLLAVLAAVMKGQKKKALEDDFYSVCKALGEPSVCRTCKCEEQANCLLCVETALLSGCKVFNNSSYEIFTVLISIMSLTESNIIRQQASKLLDVLRKTQSMPSLLELYKIHIQFLLNDIVKNIDVWSSHNPEVPIFITLVENGCLMKTVLTFSIPYIVKLLNPEKEAKLRSKFLSLVTMILKTLPKADDQELENLTLQLVREGLLPNLVWAPGMTASALRKIAVANLYEIFDKGQLLENVLSSFCMELIPILKILPEDDSNETRLLACRILEKMIPHMVKLCEDYCIHSTVQEYLSCLDDESDEVRLAVMHAFKGYFTSFSEEYNWDSYSSFLKNFYKNILIHMDDSKSEIRNAAFDLLKVGAFASRTILLEELKSARSLMNAQDLCDEMEKHIKLLSIND